MSIQDFHPRPAQERSCTFISRVRCELRASGPSAARNGLASLPFKDVAEMRASYAFHDLPSFLRSITAAWTCC